MKREYKYVASRWRVVITVVWKGAGGDVTNIS